MGSDGEVEVCGSKLGTANNSQRYARTIPPASSLRFYSYSFLLYYCTVTAIEEYVQIEAAALNIESGDIDTSIYPFLPSLPHSFHHPPSTIISD